MKTLAEILEALLRFHDASAGPGSGRKMDVEEATSAIAKEMMGIIGEDETVKPWRGDPNYKSIYVIESQNKLRKEQRARQTAFIGHKEK